MSVKELEKESSELTSLKKNVVCPVELSLRMFGGKWRGSILYQLREQNLRFNELLYRVQDAVVYYDENTDHFLSSKVLTDHLNALMAYGLVQKVEGDEAKVYGLTEKGKSAIPILLDLFWWGEKNFQAPEQLNM